MKQTDRHTALREQLIDAAERTIADKGLAALKARDLAREVGCAVGTIYNVFEHLDELVLCVGSRTLAMLEAALAAAVRRRAGRGSAEEAVDDLVRLALAYLEFAATHTVRWRALFEHRMSEARPLPEWFVEQQHRLFAQVERPLAALLPELDRDAQPGPRAHRVLGRARHRGTRARGKARLAAVAGSRRQLAATVRAIATGRDELRAIDSGR